MGDCIEPVHCHSAVNPELSIGLGLYRLGRDRTWILENCPASIRSDAGAKSRFTVSVKVIAITGIKQRQHLVVDG